MLSQRPVDEHPTGVPTRRPYTPKGDTCFVSRARSPHNASSVPGLSNQSPWLPDGGA